MTLTLAAAPSALAANLYVAPAGRSAHASAACSRQAPCASVSRALAIAKPGQRVIVAPGRYGSQTLSDGPESGPAVRITAASGTRPVFGGLNVRTGHVSVSGIDTGFPDIQHASDVTVRGGNGSGLFIGAGTSDIRIIGGSYGGGRPDDAPVKIQGSPAPTRITLDGVIFHDAIRQTEGAHLECIYAADVQGFTVRNSQFRNCAIMDLFLTNLSGRDPANVLIENNFFDKTGSHANYLSHGYYSLMVSSHLRQAVNYTIRNNSFGQSMSLDAGTMVNTHVDANVGELGACRRGVAYDHNVWSGRRCGPTDRVAAPGFVDPADYDYHLRAGSAAIGAARGASVPATDIDGQARPIGRAPDAGADEFGTANGHPHPRPHHAGPHRRHTHTTVHLRRVRGHRHLWRVSGHVKGSRGGRVVVKVQRRVHAHWHTSRARKARVGKHHRYRMRIRIGHRAGRRVLVHYRGTRGAAASRAHVRVPRH